MVSVEAYPGRRTDSSTNRYVAFFLSAQIVAEVLVEVEQDRRRINKPEPATVNLAEGYSSSDDQPYAAAVASCLCVPFIGLLR